MVQITFDLLLSNHYLPDLCSTKQLFKLYAELLNIQVKKPYFFPHLKIPSDKCTAPQMILKQFLQ